MTRARLQSILRTSWWVLFPAFSVLVARLTVERICGDPYDLLRALTSNPATALLLAGIYVIAHAWIISAYLLSVDREELVPRLANISRTWRRDSWRVYAMAAVFVIEYFPNTFWTFVGVVAGCAT
jgi:hypothetical protein